MIKILANDGIHPDGQAILEGANYIVDTTKIPQNELMDKLQNYDVVIVRSATKIRKELIDNCPNLKIIARAGVGLDNIDHEYAKSKGIVVINTPNASSQSVAELVFAHLFGISRFLHLSNREMPEKGASDFKVLKKSYAKGSELKGKKLGIIGLGNIGQAVAKMGIGLGMHILAVDPFHSELSLDLKLFTPEEISVSVKVKTLELDEVLSKSDYLTLHVPFLGKPLLSDNEFAKMKDGIILVNAARGGVIDESALLRALESGKINVAALDVFENEPTPCEAILKHSKISLTPHIGASTLEAQSNIGVDLADKIIATLGK